MWHSATPETYFVHKDSSCKHFPVGGMIKVSFGRVLWGKSPEGTEMQDKIIIKGAREHNLKNIDVEIPRNKLVVITGLSGSGKSSLAFDTIYAEGQRRYVESLSAYARQFLEQMDKPDVDSIEGLSPAISIEQKTTSKNPRSTVGTVTEIYDYLRLLFARVGRPHCYSCGKEITSQTVSQMVDRVMEMPAGTKLSILAPIVRDRKGEYRKELAQLKKDGYVRVRVDGTVHGLDEEIPLAKTRKHTIEAVVDRIVIKGGIEKRLADSIEVALKLSEGIIVINPEGGPDVLYSEKLACIDCGISYPEVSPRMFSFNNPHGACPGCDGLGVKLAIDADLVIPNPTISIRDGAVKPWSKRTSVFYFQILEALAEHFGFDITTRWEKLPRKVREVILFGSDEPVRFWFMRNGRRQFYHREFEGVVNNLSRRYTETESAYIREEIEQYMGSHPCPSCGGARLRPESLAIKIGGMNIAQTTALSVKSAGAFMGGLSLTEKEAFIAEKIMKEIRERLGFLINVGLDYLTLDRKASTLSGGEAERIRLATQIGSSLMGVLYILDEPSIGLHQRDNERLLDTLTSLRDLGNTVLVVEHDEETIERSDYVIDMGPGAGVHGGYVVSQGTPAELMADVNSVTGGYVSGRLRIPVPKHRRRPHGKITIKKAEENNLKGVSVDIPLGVLTCVTGVSGSGKSSLTIEVLYKTLAQRLFHSNERAGRCAGITGLEKIDKVIDIDQSPIGRTPRSNPATYTGLFTPIRDLFSQAPESRMRGYKPGRYSFNVKGGRCEACQGDGVIKIEMHFLPDVYVTCDVCKGKRYNRETLDIRYKGKNISEVLGMTVEEALGFFENVPSIKHKLATLNDVGLSYITLGQSAPTLSGGEAQRVKLSKELSKRSTGRTIYILDEPTTGLHFADIQKLLDVLARLVDAGNTVVVIEHNLDVIKTADHVIDLGPEGGDAGGEIIATGTPEDIAKVKASHTGRFLKKVLAR